MNDTLLIRGVFEAGESPQDIVVRNGMVAGMKRAGGEIPDLGDDETLILPPLYDIQVNGAFGIDLQSASLTEEQIAELASRLAAHGVLRWLPTIITASADDTETQCRRFAASRANPDVARAIPGFHVEGPYISPVDGPRGAHRAEHVRPPCLAEFKRLQKAAKGLIRCITLAPETEGAIPFIRSVAKSGVLVALGHLNADDGTISAAVRAGAYLSTHLGNGMAGMVDRHKNPIWAQLAEDALCASLIPDLEHLPPPVLKSLIRAKGPERIVLISDAMHAAGLKPGRYDLAGRPVEMLRSGRVCLSGTPYLAGSSLMLLQGLVNAVQAGGMTWRQAGASASSIPGRLTGVDIPAFPPRKGDKAEFLIVALDKSRPRWKANLECVFANGKRLK